MSVPRDHHFVPVFYLKRWHGADDKLFEYSMKNEKFLSKRVGARATGYERDLYSFPDLPENARHVLESKFLATTDYLAAQALDQLYSGNTKWSAELRSAWSRFVLNFRIRHPDPLKEIRNYIKASWNKSDEHYESEYAKLREPGRPATFAEYMASLSPETGERIQLRLLQSVLDHEGIGQRINEMQWDVIDLSRSRFRLLTSDWPAELTLSRGIISLPIGPHLLFVATADMKTLRRILTVKYDRLVETTNKFVVGSARRFVYSQDDGQRVFIARHFGKGMMVPPLWPSLGRNREPTGNAT